MRPGDVECCSSERKDRASLDDMLLEMRALTRLPQTHAVHHAIFHRAALATVDRFRRSRDADELTLERLARRAHRRITVPIEIHESEMRCQVWVRQRARPFEITRSLIFEACTHAVAREQVEHRLEFQI